MTVRGLRHYLPIFHGRLRKPFRSAEKKSFPVGGVDDRQEAAIQRHVATGVDRGPN